MENDKNKTGSEAGKNTGKPEKWHCDIYCRKVRHVACEGQDHLDSDAPDLCPYFDEMLY